MVLYNKEGFSGNAAESGKFLTAYFSDLKLEFK